MQHSLGREAGCRIKLSHLCTMLILFLAPGCPYYKCNRWQQQSEENQLPIRGRVDVLVFVLGIDIAQEQWQVPFIRKVLIAVSSLAINGRTKR